MKKLILCFVALFFVSCNQPAEEAGPTNSDYVKRMYDAFEQGDIDTVLAGLTEDVNWSEAENFIYDHGNPYVGHNAVVEGVFGKIGAEWEYWNLTDKAYMNVEDDKVLVTGRYQAKNKASGKLLDAQFAHLWTMRDSLASSFQQYTDTKQAAEAAQIDVTEEPKE